jgi:hypothetical protein
VIKILAIPNYYCSYYLLGLSRISKISYTPVPEFMRWNNFPYLIFEAEGKRVVIDNDDPIGIRKELLDQVDIYFVTNKLLDHPDYLHPKVKPLFPHYPVKTPGLYTRIFGLNWITELGSKTALQQAYTLQRRPAYEDFNPDYQFNPYVFFAGSIWKKETWANQMRAEFIRSCKRVDGLGFEGGMLPRTDRNNLGLDDVLSPRKYSSDEFSVKSAKSLVVFNNPAVLGAMSWRVAECLNRGSFILSLPWKIELPKFPIHGEEIHEIQEIDETEAFLKFLLSNPSYHRKISEGGKAYFQNNCRPQIQAAEILNHPKF